MVNYCTALINITIIAVFFKNLKLFAQWSTHICLCWILNCWRDIIIQTCWINASINIIGHYLCNKTFIKNLLHSLFSCTYDKNLPFYIKLHGVSKINLIIPSVSLIYRITIYKQVIYELLWKISTVFKVNNFPFVFIEKKTKNNIKLNITSFWDGRDLYKHTRTTKKKYTRMYVWSVHHF